MQPTFNKVNSNMFQLIKDIIFGFRFKRAVKKADRFHHITHRKYMVLVIMGNCFMIFYYAMGWRAR